MSSGPSRFTDDHAKQYQNLATDHRLFADLRFKVAGLYMVSIGFLANMATSHRSVVLGLIGVILSYLFISWEKRTTQWWQDVFESLKTLETMAKTDQKMVDAYSKWVSQEIHGLL